MPRIATMPYSIVKKYEGKKYRFLPITYAKYVVASENEDGTNRKTLDKVLEEIGTGGGIGDVIIDNDTSINGPFPLEP